MDTHKQSHSVFLMCNEHFGAPLGKACEHDADNDVVYLVRATNIMMRGMFNLKQDSNGLLDVDFQEGAVLAGTSIHNIKT